jgi:hypothetical protein
MGACDFYVSSRQTDANVAFRTLVDQSQYEDGAGGYTGTIAEKSDFTILTHAPQSPEELEALQEKHSDGDKWGPAYAAPFAESSLGKERTVKVRAKSYKEAEEALGVKLKDKSFKIKEMKAVNPPHSLKITTAKFPGKPKIKYQASNVRELFDTAAKALTAGRKHMKALKDKGHYTENAGFLSMKEITVVPFIVVEREGGPISNEYGQTSTALSTTKIGMNDKVVTWEATVVMRKVSSKIAGWSFWGWASS